ncbi:hypothetical protein [Ferrovibrio xuzhouensis]|uniref:Lipoprotein n=1 Tax=Ferrovibrio xuzhouensis TaxID=1576914 RepID=A0ABV7VC47_9PROT
MILRRVLLPGLLLALAGCATPTEWTKPGTPVAQRDQDQKQCSDKAYWQALDESQSSHPLYPPYTGTGFGWGPPFGPVESPSYFSRGPREAEFIAYCMQQRGYSLTPLPVTH